MTPLIDLHEVFVVHRTPGRAAGGVAALRGMSFELEPEELCVVLGPSGSGKSTLARVLAGLERPSAGKARVGDVDLVAAGRAVLDRYRRGTVGYADQHYWRALAGELTAEELVALPLGLRGVDRPERTRRALALLERVGLLDRAGARPAELSGGEQQRIAVCAALVHEPAVLVADEPTGELDRDSARSLFGLLRELTKAQQTTAVVVSHDPTSVAIADRVVHVRDGRVSEEERDGGTAVVVGRGGWLRVPEPALRAAGITTRATVAVDDGAVVLRAVGAPASAQRLERPTPGAAGLVVEARSVTRRFGRTTALAEFSARFDPGTFTAVTGPSGSGKSTLLALLAGLDTPDGGTVTLGELVISELTRTERADLRRSTVAVAGQTPGLSGFQTAVENVTLALALRGGEEEGHAQSARDALARVGLAEHADRRVDALSAGERERVALARAVAAAPAVLIADEPTSRLDSLTTVAIGELLAELAAEHGTTVICSTHDPLLIELADRELAL
jgi:ABC-type lipoprotein export system ATPase subunit